MVCFVLFFKGLFPLAEFALLLSMRRPEWMLVALPVPATAPFQLSEHFRVLEQFST